ncbi:uncharacterized protein BDV14DRAFT_193512 [Aspergillus stella-maris]|uniref:uncharacterized protein n=1 Tax=Aspergillus stella-maris TaxID=1810926 RepID=UPI003CCDBBF5
MIAVNYTSYRTATTSPSCNAATLNTTTYLYPIITAGTTIFDVANATGRGVCDIGRQNLMADVTIVPNVGQEILIPPETCTPDNESCLLPNTTTTNTCIVGGPRLYYTVNGDTYARIAQRLNITVDSLMAMVLADEAAGDDEQLEPGNFVKVPLCSPSSCTIEPYEFTWGVYKDLAERFGTTVGQIMMLSPTYNYSSAAFAEGGTFPPINVLTNCSVGRNVTSLD